MRLRGNRVVVGVSGGISVYKVCELVRLLKKGGFDVQVLMTEDATRFVTPETFRVLSGREVLVDVFETTSPDRVEHVSLPADFDLLVVAPATANTLAKMAHGLADNMLTCTFLAFPPERVLVCPAMNHRMFSHPATEENLRRLSSFGVRVLEPAEGSLACGETGKGRLPEAELIYEEIVYMLSVKDMESVDVLVTAGPTREHIDPVRFISNPSSGKMGYAIAKAARRRGARVRLVSGPVEIEPPYGVEVFRVTSAEDMYNRVMALADDVRVFIMAAAVADYRPKRMYREKLKKERVKLDSLELERTPDIISEVIKRKRPDQFVVGFAAETEDVYQNALEKMRRKGMDMIVANKATEAFGKETNRVVIISSDGEVKYLPEMEKEEIADEILDEVVLKVINTPQG